MESLKEKIFDLVQAKQLSEALQIEDVQLKNVYGSLNSFIVDIISKKLKVPVLYIANSLESAEKVHDDLEFIKATNQLAFLPGIHLEPYETGDPRPELVSMRLEAMQVFLEHDNWIAVCTFESLLEKLPLPETFLDKQIYLKTGISLGYDKLINQLDQAGFERVDIVEQVGEFGVRGGIIDIFAWNNEEPVRLEYSEISWRQRHKSKY